MKFSRYWVLLLILCFIAGALHGLFYQKESDSLNVLVENPEFVQNDFIDFFKKKYNVQILTKEISTIEEIRALILGENSSYDLVIQNIHITDQLSKENLLREIKKYKSQVHHDFISSSNSKAIPVYWKKLSQESLVIYSIGINIQSRKVELIDLFLKNYLSKEFHYYFIVNHPYSSALIFSNTLNVPKEKQASHLRALPLFK